MKQTEGEVSVQVLFYTPAWPLAGGVIYKSEPEP